ncbi:MAG: alpha/beta fold hydrolase [Actinobacteria bacterium]|nr:alpha/beta fold hydrolase [Actinomycetota bacterium]
MDLVFVSGILLNLESAWSEPFWRRVMESTARLGRVILLDRRGSGLSDRLPPGSVPSLEERIDDIAVVMDAAGSERAVIYGSIEGGQVAIVFAATYPERTDALVLFNTYAHLPGADDPDLKARIMRTIEREWGSGLYARWWGRSEEHRKVIGRWERLAATPSAAAALVRTNFETDVRDVLGSIRVPTLVMQSRGDPLLIGGREIAEQIRGSRYVELEMPTLFFEKHHLDELLGVMQEFLTGHRAEPDVDRVLKTVLFTDIVGSTERAAEVGDRKWKELLDQHDAAMREELERFRGDEIKTTGDGFLAAFDGPARAVRCAQAVGEEARRLGLAVRAGVHTGECELRGDDLAGIAVHIGARVASLAGPGEVFVTSTVRDLVAGSGIEFADRGRHELKGVPGEWQLLAVCS